VKNRFQNLPCKCNLRRYVEDYTIMIEVRDVRKEGLHKLNSVDP
jgi:hypothetical protein